MEKSRILIAVDFTPSSALALAEGCRLAKALDARLELVHAFNPLPAGDVRVLSPFDTRLADSAREKLTELATALTIDGIEASPHLRMGSVVKSLLEAIRQLKPSLVVTGSHGKGVITRALIGSVADSLVRRSPVPVLVVPSPRRHEAAAHAAWCCRDCGHIFGDNESTDRCGQCGANPPEWISAPISREPIDAGEPAVGEVDRETVSEPVRNDPAGLFATSPAGTTCDVNPELRVRY